MSEVREKVVGEFTYLWHEIDEMPRWECQSCGRPEDQEHDLRYCHECHRNSLSCECVSDNDEQGSPVDSDGGSPPPSGFDWSQVREGRFTAEQWHERQLEDEHALASMAASTGR